MPRTTHIEGAVMEIRSLRPKANESERDFGSRVILKVTKIGGVYSEQEKIIQYPGGLHPHVAAYVRFGQTTRGSRSPRNLEEVIDQATSYGRAYCSLPSQSPGRVVNLRPRREVLPIDSRESIGSTYQSGDSSAPSGTPQGGIPTAVLVGEQGSATNQTTAMGSITTPRDSVEPTLTELELDDESLEITNPQQEKSIQSHKLQVLTPPRGGIKQGHHDKLAPSFSVAIAIRPGIQLSLAPTLTRTNVTGLRRLSNVYPRRNVATRLGISMPRQEYNLQRGRYVRRYQILTAETGRGVTPSSVGLSRPIRSVVQRPHYLPKHVTAEEYKGNQVLKLGGHNYKVEAKIASNDTDLKPVLTVADTGAGPNLISLGSLDSGDLVNIRKDKALVKLIDANGKSLHLLGVISLWVELEDYKCSNTGAE